MSAVSVVWGRGHASHAPAIEVQAGHRLPAFDRPERIDVIVRQLSGDPRFALRETRERSLEAVKAVHEEGLLECLVSASRTAAELEDAVLFADTFEHVKLRGELGAARSGTNLRGSALLGRYCFDTITAVTPGTYAAAIDAAGCAVTAADLIGDANPLVLALTRPAGHHVSRRLFGGGTFLNNAAIAAEHLRHAGNDRVAVLDVDAHHGNGTQSIFYRRADVLTVSLHADPTVHFPHFTGYADERGLADGAGLNLNLVLRDGARLPEYLVALETAIEALSDFDPAVLVVSLGFDGHVEDPACAGALQTEDFGRIGAEIAGLGVPVLALLEGGYALDVLGHCVDEWATGFCDHFDGAAAISMRTGAAADTQKPK